MPRANFHFAQRIGHAKSRGRNTTPIFRNNFIADQRFLNFLSFMQSQYCWSITWRNRDRQLLDPSLSPQTKRPTTAAADVKRQRIIFFGRGLDIRPSNRRNAILF